MFYLCVHCYLMQLISTWGCKIACYNVTMHHCTTSLPVRLHFIKFDINRQLKSYHSGSLNVSSWYAYVNYDDSAIKCFEYSFMNKFDLKFLNIHQVSPLQIGHHFQHNVFNSILMENYIYFFIHENGMETKTVTIYSISNIKIIRETASDKWFLYLAI